MAKSAVASSDFDGGGETLHRRHFDGGQNEGHCPRGLAGGAMGGKGLYGDMGIHSISRKRLNLDEFSIQHMG